MCAGRHDWLVIRYASQSYLVEHSVRLTWFETKESLFKQVIKTNHLPEGKTRSHQSVCSLLGRHGQARPEQTSPVKRRQHSEACADQKHSSSE